MKKIAAALVLATAAIIGLSGCASDADVAADNLSKAAEQFEIERRIVFVNGITNTYLFEITGRCSVETANSALANALEVTCKTGPSEYLKHYLGLSDNTLFSVEQLRGADVSAYNYKFIFKPETIIPDVDVVTSSTP